MGDVLIRAVGLRKRFGDKEVLRGIDLAFERGTTTVILGASGSGKTVLMKHLIGLHAPDSGVVEVFGNDLNAMDTHALNDVRAKFGMVFQWAALFDSMTVGDNVAFPLRERHRKMPEDVVMEKVREKLALFGLAGTEGAFPADLSGGMRKRVGLARAIILEPEIVLYDEPTTGLDPITTAGVDEMILTAQEKLGVTSVVISHDIASALNVADNVAFLHEGEIVAYAPPAELRASTHPFVSRFLGTWFDRQ